MGGFSQLQRSNRSSSNPDSKNIHPRVVYFTRISDVRTYTLAPVVCEIAMYTRKV